MPEPTPEQIEEYRKQEAMHTAAVEASEESMWQFIQCLKPEELIILRNLLLHIETPADKARLDGILVGALRLLHRVCEACGVDHTKEAMETLSEQVNSAKRQVEPGSVEISSLLSEYGVYFETLGAEPVKCNECGYWNPSLDDRMLRAPKQNGCLGCQLKSEQG